MSVSHGRAYLEDQSIVRTQIYGSMIQPLTYHAAVR